MVAQFTPVKVDPEEEKRERREEGGEVAERWIICLLVWIALVLAAAAAALPLLVSAPLPLSPPAERFRTEGREGEGGGRGEEEEEGGGGEDGEEDGESGGGDDEYERRQATAAPSRLFVPKSLPSRSLTGTVVLRGRREERRKEEGSMRGEREEEGSEGGSGQRQEVEREGGSSRRKRPFMGVSTIVVKVVEEETDRVGPRLSNTWRKTGLGEGAGK